MSRLRRLKQNRRKNTIKTTMASLALVLAIGSTQVIGTYALFTDTVDVPSDLSISTGDVDVKVGEGLDFTDVQPGDEIEIPVTITNQGTLNQNISLKLDISDKITKHLTKREFVFDGITINDDGVMYNNEELFVLAPRSSITGSINITVSAKMDKEEQNSLAGKPQNVNLIIESTQVNKDNNLVNNGFCDVAIQENTISVAQREIITIATGEKAHFTGKHGNSFKNSYIPVNVKGTNNEFELSATVSSGSNSVEYDAKHYKYRNEDYILIQPKKENDSIEFKGVVNITITVTVKKDGTVIESYNLKCNVTITDAGNDCDRTDHPTDGNEKCHVDIVNTGHKTILNILEEGEAEPESPEVTPPTEGENQPPQDTELPDVEQKPEEDVDKPQATEEKSEEIKLPKEEVVTPSKPDIIAPSKEEIEIQE